MSRLDDWLDATIRPHAGIGGPLLVLCRGQATVHAVRSWIARRGGLAGIDVATPRAVAAMLEGPWLGEREPVVHELPDTPFADRIRARPGLVGLARQRVRELRLHRLAQPDLPAPGWLDALAATGWGERVDTEARLLALAQRAAETRSRREPGARLTAEVGWRRVVAIGFHTPVDPWTGAVRAALVGPTEPEPPEAELPEACGVPDTASEARLAALHARADPLDTLILVQHDATAARVHRALHRAGVPSAWRPTSRLERHSLATVVRRCVPWFSGSPDPNLRAIDLHDVLRHPMVLGRLPPPAQTWLEGRLSALELDPAHTALSPRAIARSVRRARHLDAPLSRWIATLDALATHDPERSTRGRAVRLLARLKVLEACVRGVAYDEVFRVGGPDEDADWGDFDALVADLLGGQDPSAPPDAAPAGTLGALRRFLLACRLRTGEDPASLRILGALRQGADRPATRVNALELLRGVVEKGELHPGVSVLHADDWDGRPCGTLILLDLHDQGVAARPTPDPLLRDAELRALGLLDGRGQVDERLRQLRRAAAKAERVVPIVTARDVMGRAVVPPVQLDLRVAPAPTGAYGLALDGPERPALTALRVDGASPEPPVAPDPALTALAIQATAEWSRHGLGPIGAPPAWRGEVTQPTLGHLLLSRPSPPDWLTPWLGDCRDAPEAVLPEAQRSVSRFFNPLTHCMYQAYGKAVLRLDEPEAVHDELDPREIGRAAHAALEAVALRGAWSHDGEQDAVVQSFTEHLRSATKPAFDEARRAFGALSPARVAATEGLEARWTVHWARYARARVRRARGGVDPARADDLVYGHRYLDAAVDALLRQAHAEGLTDGTPRALRYWLKDASDAVARGEPLDSDGMLCAPSGRTSLPTRWVPLLRGFIDGHEFKRLVWLQHHARELSTAVNAPTIAAVAELPFGDDPSAREARLGTLQADEPARIGPIRVPFGERDLAVIGSIDRVSFVAGPRGPLVRIVDTKSGANAPTEREARDRLVRLVEPQLVIYALVVRQALAEGRFGQAFPGARVATVGWDHLRATDDALELQPARDGVLLDDVTLTQLARAIGLLVDRASEGSWPLVPHADTCPELSGWSHDHCPFAGACRLRGATVAPEAE